MGCRFPLRIGALALALVLSWLMPRQAAATPADEAALPLRFHVSATVKPRFLDLLTYSATFRRQCQRIADAGVRVVIEVGAPWEFTRHVNGFSTLIRDERGRLAFVRVRLSLDAAWSELLPHELEHVVEQLDGVNLAAVAAQRDGRAWRVNGHAYETRRAHDAGQRADREYRMRTPLERVAARAADGAAGRAFDARTSLSSATAARQP